MHRQENAYKRTGVREKMDKMDNSGNARAVLARLAGVALIAMSAGLAWAQEDERTPDDPAAGNTPVPLGAGSASPGELVMGTGSFMGAAANDAFAADPVADTSSPVFSGVPVGGMVYDAANSRMLFTTSGTADADWTSVFEWPISGGAPSQVGTIAIAGGPQLRIDGLAFSNGTLYGVHQFDDMAAPAGLFSIDTSTFEATSVASLPSGAFSGLAADPATGTLYGPNDTAGELQSIALDGTLTTIAAYPAGESDIDGATAEAGIVYLVTDASGNYYAYDLGSGMYTNLTSPFSTADTFSGAGFVGGGGIAQSVPTLGNTALILLGGFAVYRRMG